MPQHPNSPLAYMLTDQHTATLGGLYAAIMLSPALVASSGGTTAVCNPQQAAPHCKHVASEAASTELRCVVCRCKAGTTPQLQQPSPRLRALQMWTMGRALVQGWRVISVGRPLSCPQWMSLSGRGAWSGHVSMPVLPLAFEGCLAGNRPHWLAWPAPVGEPFCERRPRWTRVHEQAAGWVPCPVLS